MTAYPPATQPTFYFIGVTTAQSSIMRVFPAWARHLGLAGAVIRGIDFPPHAEPARYREAVAFLKADPLSLGALVTTHKLDLFAACRDLFDDIDPQARLMAETSCLSKRDGRLIAHAKDPISSGLAIDGFLAPDHFARTGAEAFAIGAGGSTIAITWHLMQGAAPTGPARIVVSDRSPSRGSRTSARSTSRSAAAFRSTTCWRRPPPTTTALLAGLRPGSLVVNATGLGKDAPARRWPTRRVFPRGRRRLGAELPRRPRLPRPGPRPGDRRAASGAKTAGAISSTAGPR